jgi:hypothetical protein
MKIFLSVLVFLLFSSSLVKADQFLDVKVIKLKKDEQKKILVKYGEKEKLFKFRWTLYQNDGLVILRSYDQIVSQNVLYLRNKNQSFRVYLQPKGARFHIVPYILLKFKAFDYESDEATFELFLSDKNLQISLKYL